MKAEGRNLIAVASGKGGVGKTWFSITLSHAFALTGRRVLLFDGDLGLANVDIQLGLVPDKDLSGVIAGRFTLEETAQHHSEGGFDIVAGHSGSGSLATLPPVRLMALHKDLVAVGKAYDRVVVDLGAGIENTVRWFTGNSGICLVLTTDEPTSLTDAYAFIKLTAINYPETDIRIVVNLANSICEGERTYQTLLKACQSFLKISPPLAGIIRRDKQVRECIRTQAPLLARHPDSKAASDVEAIARGLLGVTE
jgi:flagellar biosynthesis protein FlhG